MKEVTVTIRVDDDRSIVGAGRVQEAVLNGMKGLGIAGTVSTSAPRVIARRRISVRVERTVTHVADITFDCDDDDYQDHADERPGADEAEIIDALISELLSSPGLDLDGLIDNAKDRSTTDWTWKIQQVNGNEVLGE